MDMELERLHRLEIGQAEIKAKVENLVDQNWVHKELLPLKDAVNEMRHSMNSLAEKYGLLLGTQDRLLKEDAERKKELHEKQIEALLQKTPMALLRVYIIPVAGFITAGAGAYAVIQQFLKAIVGAH